MSQCLCARGCPAPKRAGFDYCGKACGNQSCTHPAAPSLIPSSASSPASQPPSGGAPPGPGMCQCPDCTNDACVPHNFCSMACEYGTCTHTLPSRLSSTNVAAAPSFQSGLSSSLASGLGNTPVVFVFYGGGGGGNTRTGSNSPTCDCARGCPELKNSPHHFCSRSCGAGTCTHPPAPPASSATTTAAPSSSAPSGPSTDECKCQGCTKPVAPGFPFCSRSCGSGACGHSASPSASSSAPAPAAPAAPAAPKCACPGCSQSAFTGYMFCGRKCALAGCGHLGAVAPTTTNTSSSSSSSSSAGPKCSCHGCNNTVHAGFPFCSRKCGSGACGHPPPPPSCRCPGCVGVVQLRPGMTNSYFEFCSKKCRTKECGHTHKPGLINKLSIANPSKFNEIKAHFASKWLHGTNCPNITEIYTVDSSSSKSKFEAYRQMIIAKRPHLATGTASRGPGNSRRRFHGTNQNCGLGITSMDPCSKSSCSVCQILKSGGLKISKAKSQTGWSRFGNGIYTTSTSSKANDYSRGSTKAIFVAEVIVGDAVKLTSDQPTLTQPPGGKDAVIGEVTPGGALNYDELIVYDDDACILQYLVHYN